MSSTWRLVLVCGVLIVALYLSMVVALVWGDGDPLWPTAGYVGLEVVGVLVLVKLVVTAIDWALRGK